MTWACSARTPAAGSPPAQTDQQGSPSTTPAPEPQPAPVIAADAADECPLVSRPGEPIAIVGLTDRIDLSNALHPSNASERLLFGQFYETLLRVDCMGRVRPGLASSWRFDERSRQWVVMLREGARFSDGMPVTAADVKTGWTRDGLDGELRAHVSRLVEWVDVVDDRTLVIQLVNHRNDASVVLAHPNLPVARRVADSPLPLGTRSSWLEPSRDAARKAAPSEVTVGRADLPPLRFLVAPGDPRDLLDAGVDLLVTRDPATLDYAATLPQFQRVPLPWQQTRILLMPGRSSATPVLSEDARQVLADDAVRGEARGAQGPFWWDTPVACHLGPRPGVTVQSLAPRVVYDADDRAARDLSERFVGLARASGPAATTFLDALLPDRPRTTFQRATGLSGEDLARARRLGADVGYVVSVESRPLDACHELKVLNASVPWFTAAGIVPLVETRLQAVVRRGRSGATAGFDGALLIGANGSR
jgi:hypothetical protein